MKTLKRFNILLSSNSQLRDEIDTLRTERERFEKLYQKLEKELRYLRTDLLDSIEQSAACYEQRYVKNFALDKEDLFIFQQRM